VDTSLGRKLSQPIEVFINLPLATEVSLTLDFAKDMKDMSTGYNKTLPVKICLLELQSLVVSLYPKYSNVLNGYLQRYWQSKTYQLQDFFLPTKVIVPNGPKRVYKLIAVLFEVLPTSLSFLLERFKVITALDLF
jgi:hypothetical protein